MAEDSPRSARETVAQGKSRGGWRRLLRWTGRILLGFLVTFTLLLTAARVGAPLLGSQKSALETQLAVALGSPVSIESLEGRWFRFGPVIDVRGLRIMNADAEDEGHRIAELSIRPAVLASLFAGSLVMDRIRINRPRFELVENDTGWVLAGTRGGSGGDIDAIADFVLNTGHMQITEAGVGLRWSDGRRVQLENIYLDMVNRGGNHRLTLQARLQEQSSPFQLMADLEGDPRGVFDGKVWLHARQLEVGGLVPPGNYNIGNAEISGDLWLAFDGSMLVSAQTRVDDLDLAGTGTGNDMVNTIALGNASMTLAARQGTAGDWRLWAENLNFDWQNRPWELPALYAELGPDDGGRPLMLAAPKLDLAMTGDVIDDLLVLPDRAAAALDDLDPTGSLENMIIHANIGGGFEGGFSLVANLRDVAVQAWQGAPAGAGIQGYVQASAPGGFVELDSAGFDIHLPRVFNEPWHYDSANARVNWWLDGDTLQINSSIIDVSNDFLHGHVQFDLLNNRDSAGNPQSELTLLVGLLDMDAARKSLYLPTLDKVANTMNWLERALLGGRISRSGFVSRTSTIRGAPANSGTVMSFYEVDDASLAFLPDWPVLEGIDAWVEIDNDRADVIASAARINGMQLADIEARVRPEPGGGSWLTVTGGSVTETDLGLDFLRETPVRDNMGDFADDWIGSGNIDVAIDLGISLGASERENAIHVEVVSGQSVLTIPDYSLTLEDIRGRVVYDSGTGLTARALSASLFDFPLAASIESVRVNEIDGPRTVTLIEGTGRASRNALQAWEGQSAFARNLLGFTEGEIDYRAELLIEHAEGGENTSGLLLTSELQGLAINLPAPFRKGVDDIRPLELGIDFTDNGQWISARYDNYAGAGLRINADRFERGVLTFGPAVREMDTGAVALTSPGLVINGELNRFDYEAWETVADNFGGQAEQGALADYLSLVDVRIGELAVMEQQLDDVRARVSRSPVNDEADDGVRDSWVVSLENDLVNGDFIFPDDTSLPYRIDLAYLRFPQAAEPEGGAAAEENEADVDIFENVDPATLSDMDFSTMELTVGDKRLGAWEFSLRTMGNGASISNFKLTTDEASIRDNSGEAGANLDWRYVDGVHTTSFTGLFQAGDLASVLPAWGFNANVESTDAAFVSNLQWSGSPAAFALTKVAGYVNVDINRGRFVDIDSGTSRLFGALSFDSIIRRLQLDFSDLYEKGFAYDNIRGQLEFNRGIVNTMGRFVIEGPSSRISIDGEIDLVNETIDADMLVNVPLGQNLSVLAGILGAWPLALSTYVASKIFQDQVDDFTTVLYRLEGPWENLEAGFEPPEDVPEPAEPDAGGAASSPGESAPATE